MQATPPARFTETVWKVAVPVGIGFIVLVLASRLFLGGPEFVVDENAPIADHAWPMVTLQGEEVTLGDYRGKTVFLNMWASWCPPCMAEMPSIDRLHKAVGNEEIAVLAMSWDEELADIEDALASRQITGLPVLLPVKEAPPGMEFTALPTTFIIAPDGRIVFRHAGAHEWDSAESLAFLRQIAALPSTNEQTGLPAE
jgi:thiol-disulfide isomerase/thioredoxin